MSGLSRLRPLAAQLLSLRRLSSRAYGSAAAQLQYDSDYYDEEEQQLQQHGLVETEGSVPGRGVKWVLIGHRGVQRRVYAERLSKLLEVPHISMGSLVRQELHPSSSLYKQVTLLSFEYGVCQEDKFDEILELCIAWFLNHYYFSWFFFFFQRIQIANAVNEGKLVPEEIIFTLLSRRLEEGYCRGETGFILDGIPRTRMQAVGSIFKLLTAFTFPFHCLCVCVVYTDSSYM
jgi:adenylate kinase